MRIVESYLNEKSEKQEEYQKFFKEMLAKYKVESPDDLDEDQKKKFFSEVKKEWNKKK